MHLRKMNIYDAIQKYFPKKKNIIINYAQVSGFNNKWINEEEKN